MGAISKQGALNFIILGGGALLGFLVSAKLIPSLLSTEQNGILKLLVSYSVLAGHLLTLGTGSSLLKLYPHFIVEDKLQKGVSLPLIGIPFLVIGVLALFTITIGPHIVFSPLVHANSPFLDYAWLLLPLTFFHMLFLAGDSILRVFKLSIHGTFLKEFLQRVLFLFGALLLLYMVITPSGYIFWYAISLCIPAVLIWLVILRKNLLSFDFKSFKAQDISLKQSFKSLALFGMFAGLTSNLVVFLDTLMVEKLLGTSFTGIYAVMGYFGILVYLPGRAIDRIAAPIASGLLAAADLKKLKQLYRNSCYAQFLSGSLIAGLILVNIDLVFSFIPEAYAPGKWALIFLLFSNLVDASTGLNTTLISVSKYYRYNTLFMALLAGLTILTNLLLIPILGLTGAALATCLSITLYNILKFRLIWVKLKIQPYRISFLWGMMCFALALVVGLYVQTLTTNYHWFVRAVIHSCVFIGLLAPILTMKDFRLFLTPLLPTQKQPKSHQ
jgi:O-antigen/teichoic acid export membrane protein